MQQDGPGGERPGQLRKRRETEHGAEADGDTPSGGRKLCTGRLVSSEREPCSISSALQVNTLF